MILVEIRCKVKGCGAKLATLNDKTPHKVSGLLVIPACKRHDGAQHGQWTQSVLAGTKAPVALTTYAFRLDLAQLRPVIAEARRTGKKQVRML